MTKLTPIKTITLVCLSFFTLIFFQSCQKDRGPVSGDRTGLNIQIIKEEAILKSLEKTPVLELLTLDWNNAKQGSVGGNYVVRIPILNNDKISSLFDEKAERNGNQTLVPSVKRRTPPKPGSNYNYFNELPPEVFFIQDKKGGNLHHYLLNFIPEGVATNTKYKRGKLYEWNLTSDTILVQNIANNMINESYGLKLKQSEFDDKTSTNLKPDKLQSLGGLKDRQISDFWKWLANLPGDILGWIGSLFGLSIYSENFSGGSGGWRISIPWRSVSDGGSSGGVSMSTGYLASGWPIYNAYIPGIYYGGQLGGTIIDENEMPGNPNDPNATSIGGGFEPYPSTHGPNVNLNTLTADYVITNFGIGSYEQQSFLRNLNNVEITAALADYIDTKQLIMQDDIEFGQSAIGYLMSNSNTSIEAIRSALIKSPNIRISFADRINYPMIANIIDGLQNKVKNDVKLMEALKKFSLMNESTILENLTTSKGPKLVIQDMGLNENGFENGDGNIYINKLYARGLYNLKVSPPQSLEFFLTSTILHEFVHFGNTVTMNRFPSKRDIYGYQWDVGKQFEEDYYGGDIAYDLNTNKIIFTKYN